MIIFIQELVMLLFLWILKLIDGIMELFSAISGISKINYHGQQVNLIELIVGDSMVGTIFWCIFILAVGLTCVFAVVALIKNMIANNRNVSTIVGKFLLAILGTLAMLAVVVLGVLISNTVLVLVSEIFQIGNTMKLSNAVFNACVEDWLNGYSIYELDVTKLTVKDIFGDYNATLFGIWPTSWKCNGMINPNTFMYLPALIASIALMIALLVAIINLAKRVYEIVFVYLVMPFSLSTLPLDDGARFKSWRETFITKVLLAYGTVFSVNIFVLILPIIMQVQLVDVSSFGNTMFTIVMLIGGAMVIPAGQTLFARLFGNSDDNHAGGGFMRSAFYGGRIAGAMAFGTAMKMMKGTAGIGKKINSHKGKKNTNRKGGGSSEKYTDSKTKSSNSTASETEPDQEPPKENADNKENKSE